MIRGYQISNKIVVEDSDHSDFIRVDRGNHYPVDSLLPMRHLLEREDASGDTLQAGLQSLRRTSLAQGLRTEHVPTAKKLARLHSGVVDGTFQPGQGFKEDSSQEVG